MFMCKIASVNSLCQSDHSEEEGLTLLPCVTLTPFPILINFPGTHEGAILVTFCQPVVLLWKLCFLIQVHFTAKFSLSLSPRHPLLGFFAH